MKIIETHTQDRCEWDKNEWVDTGVTVRVTTAGGESKEVCFHEGEPEDNTFGRDLNDAYSISDLVKLAYEAGKSGEPMVYEFVEEREEEEEDDDDDDD